MSRLTATARARSPIWWAALAVAACGVVATAHGLFEVVAACTVPSVLAALYVPITDGLALVAYAATDRLRSWSRAYAWAVVLVAAGLSGTAQAVYLGGLGEPPVQLRYGVGAWPAVAVAVAAHLLWLVARPAAVSVPVAAGPTATELDSLVASATSVQVAEGLDSLRTGLLDSVRVMLDERAPSKPASKRPSKSVSKPASKQQSSDARPPEYAEAVRRMLAAGVARSTAHYRAGKAVSAGTLDELLTEFPAVRPVTESTA